MEKELKRLKEISEKLENMQEKNKKIKFQKTKKEIAQLCLKVLEETPENKKSIREISNTITSYFVWYDYKDELNEIFGAIGELELPEEHVSGDVLEKFKEVKERLKHYLLD